MRFHRLVDALLIFVVNLGCRFEKLESAKHFPELIRNFIFIYFERKNDINLKWFESNFGQPHSSKTSKIWWQRLIWVKRHSNWLIQTILMESSAVETDFVSFDLLKVEPFRYFWPLSQIPDGSIYRIFDQFWRMKKMRAFTLILAFRRI